MNIHSTLRTQAENILRQRSAKLDTLSYRDMQDLVYELQVHQIELELQNKELLSTQAQLEKLNKKYTDLYDVAPVGYCTFDEQGFTLEANLTITRQLGLTRETLLNSRFDEYIVKEDLEDFSQHLRKVFEKETCQTCEIRLLTQNETPCYVYLESIVVRDNGHAPLRCRTAISDITEHKQAEETMLLLKNAIETAEIGITITDTKRTILYSNCVEAVMHGYTVEELIGQDVRMFSPEEHWKDIAFEQLEEHWKRESVNICKDGSLFPVYAISTPVRNTAGAPIGIITVTEDITDRKRVEKELQCAKDAAEHANQTKSDFLASMSHELRTPLNAVLGYAQILLEDESLTEKQQKGIDIIYRSGNHLLTMINDILDLSKIEAGKLELESTEFHLPGFLQGLEEMIRIRAHRKGITFHTEIASDLPTLIYGDETRLRQILLNLLSNAVKFTEEGDVTFKVTKVTKVPTIDQNNQQSRQSTIVNLQFSISDSGVGIPSDHLKDIFLPFKQVGDHRFHAQGTGLGLPISQKLVHMMGGTLHVTSTPGEGSTFWFDLECTHQECQNAATDTSLYTSHIVGFRGGRQRILIVDDNDESRSILQDMLFPLGFEMIEARDGCDAIAKALAFHPDLILMDLIMPGMDGFDTIRRIRQAPELQHVIVIAVSASAFEHTRQESFAAGCQGFLAKPVTTRHLFDILQTHLNIEWIYDDNGTGQHPHNPVGATIEEPVTTPPKEHIALLYRLAKMGDIMVIQEHIRELEKLHPKFIHFTGTMHDLAEELNILGIQEYLEQYIKE